MSQKKKAEGKIKIVREYIACRIGQADVASRLQVAPITIREWISKYEAEGSDVFGSHERNRVYTPELKIEAVLSYLNGEGSYMDICKKYKIRATVQLRSWVKVYNAHGDLNSVKHSGGGSYMVKIRNTTQEERLQIVRDSLACEKNYGEIANKYDVSYQQVRTWTLSYEELGGAGLEDRRGRPKKIRRREQSWKKPKLK